MVNRHRACKLLAAALVLTATICGAPSALAGEITAQTLATAIEDYKRARGDSAKVVLDGLREQTETAAPENLALADCLSWLGEQYMQISQPDAARSCLTRAVSVRDALKNESPQLASDLYNLALTSLGVARPDYESAEKYLRRSLALRRKSSKNAGARATVLNELAHVCLKQQKSGKEVESLLSEAIALKQKHGEQVPLKLSDAYRNLSRYYALTGKTEKAEEYKVKAQQADPTSTRKDSIGPLHEPERFRGL